MKARTNMRWATVETFSSWLNRSHAQNISIAGLIIGLATLLDDRMEEPDITSGKKIRKINRPFAQQVHWKTAFRYIFYIIIKLLTVYEIFCNLIGRVTYRKSVHIRWVAKTKCPTVLFRNDEEEIKTLFDSAVPIDPKQIIKIWDKNI